MRVAISVDDKRFSVIFHHGTGELLPYVPSTLQAIHAEFGGESEIVSENPLEIQGWINFSHLALPCSVYRVDAPGLAWHQEPFPLGCSVMVPIDLRGQRLATNEWPVLVRHHQEYWMVRPSMIRGLLRQDAQVLGLARRRNFESPVTPPSPKSPCAALVVGKFPEPIVTTVAGGLHLLQAGSVTTIQ